MTFTQVMVAKLALRTEQPGRITAARCRQNEVAIGIGHLRSLDQAPVRQRLEILFTSLLLQVVTVVNKTPLPLGVHGKTFRTNLWSGFTAKVGSRLREAEKAAEAVREQAQVDATAKTENPDSAYSRAAEDGMGGESFGYGSPAPGAGPDK